MAARPRPGVRPTTRKVLEALFAILDGMVESWEGLRVLDAFAGAGQLGLEALERGAGSVFFIDRDGAVTADLKRRLGHDPRVVVRRADARDALSRLAGPFDLVFLDPPYGSGLAALALQVLGQRTIVAPAGIVVAEHHHKDRVPLECGTLQQVRQQRYGETALTFYRRNDEHSSNGRDRTNSMSGRRTQA